MSLARLRNTPQFKRESGDIAVGVRQLDKRSDELILPGVLVRARWFRDDRQENGDLFLFRVQAPRST